MRLHRLYFRPLFRRDAVLAAAVFAACLGFYIPTLAPSVVAGDGGELQALSNVLGISHPTGYPLFILLGWLFTHLPIGTDAALRVTLVSTLAGAGAAALLYLLIRELGADRLPALAASLMAAAAPSLWLNATAADVHPLASLLNLLGLWLLLRWGKGRAPLWASALAFGFALSHHISARLFGPAVLVYVLAVEPRLLLRPRRWLPVLACLLIPFAVYAYVPLRAAYFESLPQWAGRILGVRKVVAAGLISPHYFSGGTLGLFLASSYTGFFSGGPSAAELWQAAREYAGLFQQQFSLAVIPVALVGIWASVRRDVKAGLLLVLSYLTVLVVAVRYLASVGEDGHGFIPNHLLVAVWFGVGANALIRWLGNRLHRRAWVRPVLLAGLCLFPLSSIVAHYPEAQRQRQLDLGRELLAQPLPQGAVLAGDWVYVTPLHYWQRVEGVRPDLWVLHADFAGTSLLMQRAMVEQVPFYAIRATSAGLRLLPLPADDATVITHPTDQRVDSAVRWRGYDLEPGTRATR